MKKTFKSLLSVMAIVAMAFMVSCEGPAGEDGLPGEPGIAGTDGTPGVDANTHCLECHTQAGMDAVYAEYATSAHGTPGFELGYAGPRAGCMECHSHEGYIAHADGYDPEENLDFASKITCGTCHGDHASLEEGITAPMYTDAAVTAMADGVTEFDFESSANTCAACHQSRKMGTYYSMVDTVWTEDINGNDSIDFLVPDGSTYISSSHASPHYTTMTNNVYGVGGYTTVAGEAFGAHSSTDCVTCHMVDGDHTMAASLDACNECHTDLTNFDYNGVQTAIMALETEVEDELVTLGILNADHETQVGVVTDAQFEAFWNYKIVHYDHSYGVHNPTYMKTLLEEAKVKLGL